MGFIRFLLALTIIVRHTNDIFGLDFMAGKIAVELFFMMSGFYIALILDNKYKDSIRLFYSNRLLKIFPAYWFICIASATVLSIVLWFNLVPEYTEKWKALSAPYLITTLISNIFLIGQDLFMFFGLDPITQSLFFAPSIKDNDHSLVFYLFVPQAWTLCLELSFYLVAPYILNRSNTFILRIIFISLAIRFSLFYFGFDKDPFSYRFFPAELAIFLLGSLSYQLYKSGFMITNTLLSVSLLTIFCLLILFFNDLGIPDTEVTAWIVYFIFASFMPTFFNHTKANKVDKMVGELSYPLYISHIFVILLVTPFLNTSTLYLKGTLTAIFSIIIATGIVKWIMNPIEKKRQARVTIMRNQTCH